MCGGESPGDCFVCIAAAAADDDEDDGIVDDSDSHAQFRLVTSIKDQVISMSLSDTFTAAICNESEAVSGRYAAQVPYTSALKRRESRAQLARALAARAVIAKDRCCVICRIRLVTRIL